MKIQYVTAGESHGTELTAIVEGIAYNLQDSKEYIDNINTQKEEFIKKMNAAKAEEAGKAGDAAKAGEAGEAGEAGKLEKKYTDIVSILEGCKIDLETHKNTFNTHLAGEDLNNLLVDETSKNLFYKTLNDYIKDELEKLQDKPPNDIKKLDDLQKAIESDYGAFIKSLNKVDSK